MWIRTAFRRFSPSPVSALLALISAILLVLAFPDTGIAPLAWLALIPLFVAIQKQAKSVVASILTGWIFGTAFFFGTGWWLTFAPITYAAFPPVLAYFLLFCVALIAGIFPGIACGLISAFVRRFGNAGIFSAPVFWVSAEYLRYWLTGNNWNTIGYSQAFNFYVELGSFGGVDLVGFLVVFVNAGLAYALPLIQWRKHKERKRITRGEYAVSLTCSLLGLAVVFVQVYSGHEYPHKSRNSTELENGKISAAVVAVQPNVPMNGLRGAKWIELRTRQAELAKQELAKLRNGGRFSADVPVTVILPESPMNYQYEEDPVFREFINEFARENNVSVLFNSAEPDRGRENGFFNSAILVSSMGSKAAQYDKIHLLPFGEFVPLPEFAQEIIPPMVGRFSFGSEYDLIPIGDAKAGIMICFESHFPSLSREYVMRGADVLIEMTNDGYLGKTPVLRQHLASAAFRAAETNRPVLRVTNVGVTAYINGKGEISDMPDVYTEATRVWGVGKSDGNLTVFVRFGYLFPLMCTLLSAAGLLFLLFRSGREARKS